VMRLALDEERKNREQLLGELNRAKALVNEQDRQIQETRNQFAIQRATGGGLAAGGGRITAPIRRRANEHGPI